MERTHRRIMTQTCGANVRGEETDMHGIIPMCAVISGRPSVG